jgi:hypothetical protein
MAESRIVPTNLMAWPLNKNLLPDQKLINYHLWATAAQDCGCFLLDFSAFSAHVSLAEEALLESIKDFAKKKIIDFDHETGEVYIRGWYRFHKFQNLQQIKRLKNSLKKIQSIRLRELVEQELAHGTYLDLDLFRSI